MLRRRTVASAALMLVAGLSAFPAGAGQSGLQVPLVAGPAVMSRGEQAGTREARIAVDRPLGTAPAMSAFRLDFGRSDHRIHRMAIMPDGTAFRAALGDRNGDDRFRAMGRWWAVPGATGGTVGGFARGFGEFEVPPGPPNSTLVLSGFDFRRSDGTDANVRTLAIQLDSDTRRIRTVLLDDQGTDFTALAEAVAVGFAFSIIGGPAGALGGSGGMANLNQGPVNANARLRAYNVDIAYAWVPNRYLETMREVSGSDRRRSGMSGVLPSDEKHVLTGFSLHFSNSDHFIGRMGVHMGGPDPVMSWQDSNLDDPIQWTVRYVPIRPQPQSNITRPLVRPTPGSRD